VTVAQATKTKSSQLLNCELCFFWRAQDYEYGNWIECVMLNLDSMRV